MAGGGGPGPEPPVYRGNRKGVEPLEGQKRPLNASRTDFPRSGREAGPIR